MCGLAAVGVVFLVPSDSGARRGVDTLTADTSAVLPWFTQSVPLLLTLAGSFRFMAGFVWAAFLPLYFQRYVVADPLSIPAISVWYGLVTMVAGCGGAALGGFLADTLTTARSPGAPALVAAGGSLLAIPLVLLMLYASINVALILFFLFAAYLVAEVWLGPATTMAQVCLSRMAHAPVSHSWRASHSPPALSPVGLSASQAYCARPRWSRRSPTSFHCTQPSDHGTRTPSLHGACPC